MAFVACFQNVKYFAPIAASRLYEHRTMFQQINKRAQSAKNIERTYSLANGKYTKAVAATATIAWQAPQWQQSQTSQQQQTQAHPQEQKELQ